MNNWYSLSALAKDRHSELLKEAQASRRLFQAGLKPRGTDLRKVALALATLSVAAAVTVQRVAAAVGGGGGGGPQLMF
jgi:hypothetical protein